MQDTQKGRFLTFRPGKESYGHQIQYVTEIMFMQERTTVPDLPELIIGVANL
ncbi:MAG: hypothetical protein HN580_18730 [Deltaproteobacteria bacterium]|nr:hypothetical protein [Deltaproteobacteria bacterium]MBT4087441.1 hypothetical protein [Deltaproteobacteria bacterium]MBT4269023.1 hypothetical protein [Deltaproteobacteria bacterium]MBT4638882.1 hypothetical protein [Deltaproteobacteria bacterium]MBT6502428.1 hypothetical protein [Deltaproteobacteria bacterium]